MSIIQQDILSLLPGPTGGVADETTVFGVAAQKLQICVKTGSRIHLASPGNTVVLSAKYLQCESDAWSGLPEI